MRPIEPAKLDDAVQRYLAGESLKKAAAGAGIGINGLRNELIRRDIDRRVPKVDLVEGIVERYESGVSELALQTELGISRSAIRRQLIAGGATIRGRSDAGKARARKMTPADRSAQTAAAHAAVKGTTPDEKSLMLAAQTRQRNGRFESRGEKQLARLLRQRGMKPKPEVAVGRYNIDIALPGVAVEVLGGKWHGYKATHKRRTKAILDAGWHIVFVWNHDRVPLDPRAADYVVAFAQSASVDPSAVREYRVIRGDGQLIASGRADDYELTAIPPSRKTPRRRGIHQS